MKIELRRLILIILLVAIGAAIYYLESGNPDRKEGTKINLARVAKSEKANKYKPAVEIANPSGYINSGQITIGEYIGKNVVLVDFWAYSCINCQRTFPYLNEWYKKYSASGGSASGGKDKGLVIIGIHTPEFEFEKDRLNVLRAVEKFGIKYPVVQDNDYATWRAYGNRYWPRKYLIDIDGFVVYDHIGEGAYEETENKIQELLEERKLALGMKDEIGKEISKPEGTTDVDFSKIKSREIYFGDRN